MAGGVVVAGELWIPGQKIISIPSGHVFGGQLFSLNGQSIKYIGPENKTVTIGEFYNWLQSMSKHDAKIMDALLSNETMVSLRHGHRIENPEHLIGGSLEQDRSGLSHLTRNDREYWTSCGLGDSELYADKVYVPLHYSIQV